MKVVSWVGFLREAKVSFAGFPSLEDVGEIAGAKPSGGSAFERRRWGQADGDSRSSIPQVFRGVIWDSSLVADFATITAAKWLQLP